MSGHGSGGFNPAREFGFDLAGSVQGGRFGMAEASTAPVVINLFPAKYLRQQIRPLRFSLLSLVAGFLERLPSDPPRQHLPAVNVLGPGTQWTDHRLESAATRCSR
jgi:hypothetical protein